MLGEEDADTAGGYKNLADNLTSQRKYKEAQPLYEKALAIRREVLGDEDLDTARSYANLASNLGRQRKHAEAQPHYEKALAICARCAARSTSTRPTALTTWLLT